MKKFRIISSIVIILLCTVSYRVITRFELVTPHRMSDLSSIHSINAGLLGYYASNNGKYPNNLQELVSEGFLEQEEIKLWKLNIHYVKDFDASDEDHIIMFTSTYPSEDEYSGNYGVVAYVDGNCIFVKRNELEKLLAQEIEKLRAAQTSPTE